MKKFKHRSRKVTQDQVDAMNRQLDLICSNDVFHVGSDGRLVRDKMAYLGEVYCASMSKHLKFEDSKRNAD